MWKSLLNQPKKYICHFFWKLIFSDRIWDFLTVCSSSPVVWDFWQCIFSNLLRIFRLLLPALSLVSPMVMLSVFPMVNCAVGMRKSTLILEWLFTTFYASFFAFSRSSFSTSKKCCFWDIRRKFSRQQLSPTWFTWMPLIRSSLWHVCCCYCRKKSRRHGCCCCFSNTARGLRPSCRV